MADNKGQLLPVYIVVDESGSMDPHLSELNQGLESLRQGMRADPMAAAKVRLTVLGFSDATAVRLALCDVRELTAMPKVHVGGTTSYQAAFNDLQQRIPKDIASLKVQGYEMHRPVVFFLTDGQPNYGQDWRDAYARLIDRSVTVGAPNIIACGVDEADAQTLVDVATRDEFAFLARRGADIGTAISEFFVSLTASIVRSGQALASGHATLSFTKPDQFEIAIDRV